MLAGLLQVLVAPGTQATHNARLVPDAQVAGPGLTANDLQNLKQKDPNNIQKDKPKAYLNYVFFDKQFKFVSEGSGVKQADGEPGQLETLSSGKVVAKKNGYVYVYTSNESRQDVLFDNFGVLDITGPVLEETHYYPFGLTMSGISTMAPLRLEGRRKFNGIDFNHKEFSDGSGLDLYTAKFRGLDPQIGRWWQIDPRPGYAISLYASMGLNPVLNSDFLGDTIIANTNGKIISNTGGNDNFIITIDPLPAVTVTTDNSENNSFIFFNVQSNKASVDNTRVFSPIVGGLQTSNITLIPAEIANSGFKEPPYPSDAMISELEQ
jgi:RHS repeat-associated protein